MAAGEAKEKAEKPLLRKNPWYFAGVSRTVPAEEGDSILKCPRVEHECCHCSSFFPRIAPEGVADVRKRSFLQPIVGYDPVTHPFTPNERIGRVFACLVSGDERVDIIGTFLCFVWTGDVVLLRFHDVQRWLRNSAIERRWKREWVCYGCLIQRFVFLKFGNQPINMIKNKYVCYTLCRSQY